MSVEKVRLERFISDAEQQNMFGFKFESERESYS